MRAVVYRRYGPPEVLHIEEVEKPAPKAGELLIRVRAAAVTRADCETRDANRKAGPAVSFVSRLVSGIRRPRQPILGLEFAGVVEGAGAQADELKPGDRVFGSRGFAFGAWAEYIAVPQGSRIARMPDNASEVQAAAITDGGLNALWCLRFVQPLKGKKVLVYGASGAIGTAALQLARHFVAEVTAVAAPRTLELMKELGADHVLDYTSQDFTTNGERYDVIMDAVGKHSFKRSRGSLKPGGSYIATDGLDNLVYSLWTPRLSDKKVLFKIPPRYTKQDVQELKQLVENREFQPVVDRTYPMEEIVEACRYVETEQKVGNVILTFP